MWLLVIVLFVQLASVVLCSFIMCRMVYVYAKFSILYSNQ